MTIEQHIEELRAELNACTDHQEITQIRAELAAAETEVRRHNQALDAALGA